MKKFNDIDERVIELSKYIIETGDTIREVAKVYGISKSTVHKDLSQRINKINKTLALKVKKILDINKSTRHIRGGIATRNKYLKEKKDKLLHIRSRVVI